MTIEEVFQDKTIKTKGKVAIIGEWLVNKKCSVDTLLVFAAKQLATDKATCIEALEYATKKSPALADADLLLFVTKSLKENEPRIKWESAKVIGNIAQFLPEQLEMAVVNLLNNADNPGTVVRWATAYGLAEILKLKTELNQKLLPRIEQL